MEQSSKNAKRFLLIIVILGAFFAPLAAWLVSGTTEIGLANGPEGISAIVSGTRLSIPADKLDANLRARLAFPADASHWSVDPSDSSLYWQPAQANLLGFLGAWGEWLQGLRPQAEWSYQGTEAIATAGYRLKGGSAPARLDLTAGDSTGYQFVIRAERRSIAWWRTEDGRPVEQLASDSYRPDGSTSARDMASELLLIVWAASVLGLLALGVNAVLLRLEQGREASVKASRRFVTPAWLNRSYLPALALFFGGTIVTVAVCLLVLDGIPHVQDDVAYIFQGKTFAMLRSWVPTPPGPEFFQNGFIQMYDGRWFSKYPPGYPLMLVPGLWAGLPWLINPLSAGVSLALVYAIGVRMYGRHVAAWAGLLGLVSPWVLFMSGSYMSHPTTMMWVALFLYALVHMHGLPVGASRLAAFWPMLAGFAIGMAFITREWTALGIGVGAAVWGVGDLALSGGNRLRLLGRYLLVFVGFAPPILFLLYENRQLTGEWLRFAQDLVGSYDRPGFGPGHGDTVGHTPALGVYNALVYLRTLATVFDGWPAPLALALLALGLLAWVGEKTRRWLSWDALLGFCWAGLVGAYFLWWSSTTIFGPRYWYEGMPFLLLIAGRGLDLLGRVAASGFAGAYSMRLRWLVPGALFALMTAYNLSQSLPYQASQYEDYNDITVTALRNAEQAHLQNALVFVALEPSRPNRDYGKVFFANDPLLRGNVVYARDLGPQKNSSLLGLFPGRNPYWLPLDRPPKPGVGK